MTTLRLAEDTGDDLPSRQISKRVRALMAENRVSGVRLAQAIGMGQKAFSRRYADEVEWSIDELARVANAFEVPFTELCAIRDSNPEPADSLPAPVLTLVGRARVAVKANEGAPAGVTPAPSARARRHLRLLDGRAS